MNNVPVNNLNFKSTIKIVSPKDYNSFNRELSKNYKVEEIYNWMLNPKDISNPDQKCYRTNSEIVSTSDIRSCVAGIFSNKQKPASLVIHVYDNEDNFQRLSTLDPYIEASSVFLIGSRGIYPESKKIFKHFEQQTKSKKITTTILEGFKDLWEASFIYLAKTDEIILCIKDILNPQKYIKNKDELIKAFNRVEISPNDTVEFVTQKLK